MNARKTINRLFWFVALAVCLIGLGSFALSFMALYALASDNGQPPGLAWIWPLIVDMSIVIYTAAILVAQLQRRPAKLPIGLTIFYAIVTVAGNILHAPATPLGWFVASLPPLSLIFGTELLRTMGHYIIRQGDESAAVRQMAREVRLAIEKGTNGPNVTDLATANEARRGQIVERRAQVSNLLAEGWTPPDIAGQLGVSLRTVRRDIKRLNGRAR